MIIVMSQEDITKIAIGAIKVDCSLLHTNSCLENLIKSFLHGLKLGMKIYLPLYFIPLLFKYKDLIKDPQKIIKETLKSCVRSALVLAAMAFLGKIAMCSYIRLFNKVDSGVMPYISALTSLALFIETPARISEIAVYALPRFLPALWSFLIRRGLAKNIQYGHVILFSLSTSAMIYCSNAESESIKPLYKKFFDSFLGEN